MKLFGWLRRKGEFRLIIVSEVPVEHRLPADGRLLSVHLAGLGLERYDGYIVSCSGREVDPCRFEPRRGQAIVLVPRIGGPAVAIVAVVASAAAAIAPLIGISGTVLTVLKVVGALGMLVSIFGAKKPKAPVYEAPGGGIAGSGSFSNSPTYGWEGIRTIADANAPVAIICGEHRFGGNVINSHVSGHTARDVKWKSVSMTSVSCSGYTCSFRTGSQVDGIWLVLRRYQLSYNSGAAESSGLVAPDVSPGFVQPVKGKFRHVSGGEYIMAYKIELKKAADAAYDVYEPIYTAPAPKGYVEIFSLRTKAGTTEDLARTQWDIRIAAQPFSGVPYSVNYCQGVKGRVREASEDEPDSSYLSVLLGLGEGPIAGVKDILVNGTRLEELLEEGRGPEIHIRHGYNQQSLIPGFHELYFTYAQSKIVEQASPVTYTTVGADIEAIELELSLDGLYMTETETGQISTWTVQYRIEIRSVSSGTWIDLGTYRVSEKTMNRVRRFWRTERLSPDQYVVRITRLTADPDFYHIGTLRLTNVTEVKEETYSYPNTALLGLRLLATEKLSGGLPDITGIVRGRLWMVPKVVLDSDPSIELEYDEFYHDGDDYRRFSDGALAKLDGTWVERWTANPVWIFYGLCVNDIFGLGEIIDPTSIPRGDLLPLAAYCDELAGIGDGKGTEKRFRLDVVIDAPSRGLDLLMELASTFRGIPIWSEGTIQLVIDRISSMSQLFSHGNIVQNSFREIWTSLKTVSNVLEIQFLSADKDFEQDLVELADEAAIVAGDPIRRKTTPMYGIVRRSQAVRMARYLLSVEKFCTEMCAFRVGIEALSARCGDVVGVQHRVPAWGTAGGRCARQCTVSRVVLETPVDLPAGTFAVAVRLGDGSLETRTVQESNGRFDILHATVPFSAAPLEFGPFAVGEITEVVKPFRVVGLVRTDSGEIDAAAIEYDSAVYSDEGDPVRWIESKEPEKTPVVVQDLEAAEKTSVVGGGTVSQGVQVTYRSGLLHSIATIAAAAAGKILKSGGVKTTWYQRRGLLQTTSGFALYRISAAKHSSDPESATEYEVVGETSDNHFFIPDLPAGTYTIAVQVANERGEFQSIDEAQKVEVVVGGLSVTVPAVAGFAGSWTNSTSLLFTWDSGDPGLVTGFEIRKNDANWGTSDSNRVFLGDATRFLYVGAPAGAATYYIRALNSVGAYSTTVSVSASAAPDTGLQELSEVPSGVIDGVNDTFTLSYTPNAGSLKLFKFDSVVGVREYMFEGTDFTLSGITITYAAGEIPQIGDSHKAHYLRGSL